MRGRVRGGAVGTGIHPDVHVAILIRLQARVALLAIPELHPARAVRRHVAQVLRHAEAPARHRRPVHAEHRQERHAVEAPGSLRLAQLEARDMAAKRPARGGNLVRSRGHRALGAGLHHVEHRREFVLREVVGERLAQFLEPSLRAGEILLPQRAVGQSMHRAVAEAGPLPQLQQHFVVADGVLVAAREPVRLRAEEPIHPFQFLLGEIQFQPLQQQPRAAHVTGAELLFRDAQQRTALNGFILARHGEALAAERLRQPVALGGLHEVASLREEVAPVNRCLAHRRMAEAAMVRDDALVELRGLLELLQIIPLQVRALEQHGDAQARHFAGNLERLVHQRHRLRAATLPG